jgi:hypothetical protein
MMVTPTKFLGTSGTRLSLFGVAGSQEFDLAGLGRRLGAADQAELAERRAKWPLTDAEAL